MSRDTIIFGINSVLQLLKNNPDSIKELFINKNKTDKRILDLIAVAKKNNILISNIDNKKLDKLTIDQNHQGVLAKIKPQKTLTESDIPALVNDNRNPLFVILDGIQDPHNLGACLRTCDCAGVSAVIIPQNNSVSITPVVRKVASGAAETVKVVVVANLARAIKLLQENGVWIVGTDLDADKSFYDLDLTGPIGIVLGSEGEGIRELTRKNCDFLVKMPMFGTVGSLNVSVSCGVTLYEAVRQRIKG